MSSGAVTPDFETPIQVYDSEGGLHTLTVSFLKQGANSWYAEVHLPAGEVVPTAGLVDGQLASGIVKFTPFGQIDAANSTLPTTITINQNGTAGAPQWEPDAWSGHPADHPRLRRTGRAGRSHQLR